MCGICGYVSKEKAEDNLNIINMTSTLTNRGPDNLGIYVSNNTCLGHTRLSIIDLDSGNQPMEKILGGNNYVIVYNGELYNFKEIKDQLISLGYSFSTNSDTEVILTAYIHYKEKCLDIFNGVYAFAIYSNDDDTLFIARDRLGVKPLFYTFSEDGSFVFASEIKAILKYPGIKGKITKDELCEIFGLGPAHTPGKTFFSDIYELVSGHYGVFKNGIFTTTIYWDLETKPLDDNIYVCINKIRGLVQDSLNKQLVSDVPVCTMLSGGLDSSILTYLANKKINNLATFSIDFKNNAVNFKGNDYQPTRDSDFVNIMRKVLNTKHTNIYFDNLDLYNSLKDVVIARDAPGMGDVDSSMYVFCKRIKENGYKVAISGECADEIFGGYPWYYKENLINSNTFPWSLSINTRCSVINKDMVSEEYLKNYIKQAYNKCVENVEYNSTDEFENTLRKTCYLTIKWFMNTLLERTDRTSMASGLEVRVPYADHRIFEYVYNISAKFKLGLLHFNKEPIEKYLLRKAFERNLPKKIVFRKKSPFPKTYDPEYTKLLEDEIGKIISSSTDPLLEVIDVKYLFELLKLKGENLKENWFGQLMTYPQTLAYLIQVNIWLKEYNIEIDV